MCQQEADTTVDLPRKRSETSGYATVRRMQYSPNIKKILTAGRQSAPTINHRTGHSTVHSMWRGSWVWPISRCSPVSARSWGLAADPVIVPIRAESSC
eukprot:5617707-Amphidinium_carterae.1